MNEKMQNILRQIRELEDELRVVIQEEEDKISYRIEGSKIRFDKAIKSAHRRLKTGLFTWLRNARPQSFLSAPFIYSMIVPIAFFDLALTIYQAICFRLYDISPVVRADFMVVDRHQLAYLNILEKANCVYCGYGVGVINYAREIISRTEQYWCPIKHARKMANVHSRYDTFLPFGDATAYPVKLIDFRVALQENSETKSNREA